mmetsp:Transcript_28753/g.86298  ORF Transcript_28753/g.86298 Transcript_28753/m.86298 type:complete len:229 (+) Transcript_28753:104-790(+)
MRSVSGFHNVKALPGGLSDAVTGQSFDVGVHFEFVLVASGLRRVEAGEAESLLLPIKGFGLLQHAAVGPVDLCRLHREQPEGGQGVPQPTRPHCDVDKHCDAPVCRRARRQQAATGLRIHCPPLRFGPGAQRFGAVAPCIAVGRVAVGRQPALPSVGLQQDNVLRDVAVLQHHKVNNAFLPERSLGVLLGQCHKLRHLALGNRRVHVHVHETGDRLGPRGRARAQHCR